jgi:hypothetical protein
MSQLDTFMTPISLTCPALTGGAFPEIPTMSHTITVTPRKRALNPVQRRALQLLASSPYATEALMLAKRADVVGVGFSAWGYQATTRPRAFR